MSNEYQSTSINPDVFEQFLTLLNTHCKSSETALAMWICPYISRHLLSLNPLLACCRRYSRGER